MGVRGRPAGVPGPTPLRPSSSSATPPGEEPLGHSTVSGTPAPPGPQGLQGSSRSLPGRALPGGGTGPWYAGRRRFARSGSRNIRHRVHGGLTRPSSPQNPGPEGKQNKHPEPELLSPDSQPEGAVPQALRAARLVWVGPGGPLHVTSRQPELATSTAPRVRSQTLLGA